MWIWAWTALAGVPTELPPGEDRGMWRSAFELAGLDHSAGPGAALVIRAAPDVWVVRAVAPDGRERTATAPPPRTARDREEIALLGLALARELGVAPTPRPVLPLGAPPPIPISPPRPAAPTPAPPPVAAAPRPAEPAPLDSLTPEMPETPEAPDTFLVLTAARPGGVEARPTAPTPPRSPAPAPVELEPEPARARRPPPATPPFAVGAGLTARPQVAPGLRLSFAADLLGDARRAVALELGTSPARATMMPQFVQNPRGTSTALIRRFAESDALVVGRARVADRVAVELLGGVAWHTHRQQRALIDGLFVPEIGLGVEIGTVRPGSWAVPLRARVVADLARTVLFDEAGAAYELGFLQLRLEAALKSRARGDPSRTLPTSRGR